MSSFKRYVDFDADLDVEQAKPGAIKSEWASRHKDADYKTAEEFKSYLLHQVALFDVLRDILLARYAQAKRTSIDMSNPNVKDVMLFQQGYMQAVQDIYKLLPRP